jgi:hypothetical protein
MQTTFNYYQDPGHGWVKVPMALLDQLSIRDKITPYSYRKGDNAYLEEDCDLSTLFEAFKQRGIEPKLKSFHCNKQSKIRSYANFY